MEENKNHVQIEIRLFGIGKVFQFIYDNFFLVQSFLFAISCFFCCFEIYIPMFLFLFFECFVIWCQYRAPLIDQQRREAFTKWVDSALVAEGGESCHFMNAMLDACFEKMFPDSFSPWLCDLAEWTLEGSLPGFVTDLKFTAMSYGYTPPKYLQVISDQAKAYEDTPNSVTMTWYCVFYNNMRFACQFKMFGIPIHIVMDDWVFYMPVQTVIESPEENKFLNTPIITAVSFSFTEDLIVLNNNMYFNGFNFAKLPLVHYGFAKFFESNMAAMMSNGNCLVWDWILNTYTYRHKARKYSKLSEDLFKDIATLDKDRTSPDYNRFSLPLDMVKAYDEKRKTDWDRAYKTKVPPNETLIMMAPPYQEENEPVFKFNPEVDQRSDTQIQITPDSIDHEISQLANQNQQQQQNDQQDQSQQQS